MMENTIDPTNVINFLLARNWEVGEKFGEYSKMIPPKEFGFSEDTRLLFPYSKKVLDYERHLISMLGENGVAGLYDMNPENLQLALRNNATILTFSFKSDFFEAKSIDILRFTAIIHQLQNLIQQTTTWILKENQATAEEQALYLSAYVSNCNLVKMDIDTLQLKMELPTVGEWTLANEKKIPLASIPNTLLDSLQKQIKTQDESESLEIPVQQMRLLFAIQDFIESAELSYARFSFFHTDWEEEKEVTFGEEEQTTKGGEEVTKGEEIAA